MSIDTDKMQNYVYTIPPVQWAKQFPEIALDFLYTKEESMIGGPVCHLCGAQKQFTYHTEDTIYKKRGSTKSVATRHEYRCGTVVNIASTCKEGKAPVTYDPKVFVGKKCIEIDSAKLT